MKPSFWKRIDWVNTLFLVLTPTIAFAGLAFLIHYHAIHLMTVVLAVATGIGVTAGYHRLFSHRSYDAKWPVRLGLLLLGAASFENSALNWSSDHRDHHRFVDTDKDPYNIKRGFWYAHMGWVMLKQRPTDGYGNVPDLKRDPLVDFQHRHYLILGILVGFALPMAIASLWGDALGGLLVAGFLRIVLNHHFTFSINSVCHYLGRQPYSDRDSSRDSWIPALFTYGEGYHNFHHTFPSDYRNGIKAYHFDPTKWLIRGLEFLGQTSNLHRIPEDRILKARLLMDEKRIMRKIERVNAAVQIRRELVISARMKLVEAYTRFQTLKAEYGRMRHEKMESLNAIVHDRMAALRLERARARRALHDAMTEWSLLCSRFGVTSARLAVSS